MPPHRPPTLAPTPSLVHPAGWTALLAHTSVSPAASGPQPAACCSKFTGLCITSSADLPQLPPHPQQPGPDQLDLTCAVRCAFAAAAQQRRRRRRRWRQRQQRRQRQWRQLGSGSSVGSGDGGGGGFISDSMGAPSVSVWLICFRATTVPLNGRSSCRNPSRFDHSKVYFHRVSKYAAPFSPRHTFGICLTSPCRAPRRISPRLLICTGSANAAASSPLMRPAAK